MAAAQRARGCALWKLLGSPASRRGLVDNKQGPPTRMPALPHQEFILFFVFSKRASPDSLPGVIDAGGVSFSQSLAFDLASPGGAVAAVSGTPPGAARACADFAARCSFPAGFVNIRSHFPV